MSHLKRFIKSNHENRNRCPVYRTKILENCPPSAEEQRRIEHEERMETIAIINRGLRYGMFGGNRLG
eukprot:Pgem_evm1s1710